MPETSATPLWNLQIHHWWALHQFCRKTIDRTRLFSSYSLHVLLLFSLRRKQSFQPQKTFLLCCQGNQPSEHGSHQRCWSLQHLDYKKQYRQRPRCIFFFNAMLQICRVRSRYRAASSGGSHDHEAATECLFSVPSERWGSVTHSDPKQLSGRLKRCDETCSTFINLL